MKRVKIFLDMDGFVFNWNKEACRIMGINDQDPNIRKILKNDPEGIEKICSKEDLYRTINDHGSAYWCNLDIFPWAKKVFEFLNNRGDCCFLSSPGKWLYAPAGKLQAILREFPGTPSLIGKEKYFAAHPEALLIDDHPKNIDKFVQHGGNGFLWPNQYYIEDELDFCVSELLSKIDSIITNIEENILSRK